MRLVIQVPRAEGGISGLVHLKDSSSEYERAVSEALKLIKSAKPALLSKQSIDQIHYWYCYAADCLIVAGEQKHKIVNKLYEAFDQFYGERWIREILKEGHIDVPNEGEENGSNSISDSSIYSAEYLKENASLITYFTRLQTFIRDVLAIMKTQSFVSHLPKDEFKSLLYDMNTQLTTGEQIYDKRNVVPFTQQMNVYAAIAATGVANAGEMFIKWVKDLSITPKQVTNYRTGRVRQLHPLFDPKDQFEALEKGYYGVKCPRQTCGSWRTRINPEPSSEFKLDCLDCLLSFRPDRNARTMYVDGNELSFIVHLDEKAAQNNTIKVDVS